MGQKFMVQKKSNRKIAGMYISFTLTLTWMGKGRLRKPHWGASLVLSGTNGVLAACLHRSQRGISEEFLISMHQEMSSGDSSSHQRPLNQRGGGGRAQARGSTWNRTDKSELCGRYVCSPLTGAGLPVDDFMIDEEFRRREEHGDGS